MNGQNPVVTIATQFSCKYIHRGIVKTHLLELRCQFQISAKHVGSERCTCQTLSKKVEKFACYTSTTYTRPRHQIYVTEKLVHQILQAVQVW